MGFWTAVYPIIRESQILVLVVDARMPELSDNRELDTIVKRFRKPMLMVFNKIDLISQKDLHILREKNPDAFFVSGNKNIGLKNLKIALLRHGKEVGRIPLKVGIIGYPNVGKSSIINALAHRRHAIVTSVAGTTKGPQFIRVGDLKIIDSPGVIPYRDGETKLGIISAKNPEKMRNPERVVYGLLNLILSKNKSSLEEFYGVSLSSDDAYEALLAIGRKRGFLKKGAIVDEVKTAIYIMHDWQKGKIRL